MIKRVKTSELFVCDTPYLKELFGGAEYPWEMLPIIGEYIKELIENGLEGFDEQLEAIKAVSDEKELSAMIGKMHVESASPFFGFYIGADEKNSTINLLQFFQGGISMGDRDYYLLDDENTLKIRDAYNVYVNRLFTLAGYSAEEAAKAAKDWATSDRIRDDLKALGIQIKDGKDGTEWTLE